MKCRSRAVHICSPLRRSGSSRNAPPRVRDSSTPDADKGGPCPGTSPAERTLRDVGRRPRRSRRRRCHRPTRRCRSSGGTTLCRGFPAGAIRPTGIRNCGTSFLRPPVAGPLRRGLRPWRPCMRASPATRLSVWESISRHQISTVPTMFTRRISPASVQCSTSGPGAHNRS